MEKVAVLMSVYKSDVLEYLKKSVDSILLQTYPVDFFIVRDGVVDSEIDDYLDFLSLKDNVFLYKLKDNRGLANALNYLIDIVVPLNYSFIARMDSDDISTLYRIEKQVDYMMKNKDIDVLGSFCKEFGSSFSLEEKKLPECHEDILKFSISRCPLVHPTVVFRKNVFSSGVRYPTHTKFTEDMALWFVLLERGFKFSNLPRALLNYRMTEDTACRRKGISKALSEFKIRFKYMFILKQVSVKNIFLVFSRLAFHLLPNYFLKLMYLKCR